MSPGVHLWRFSAVKLLCCTLKCTSLIIFSIKFIIAQNIANVDTPNYKAKTVSFKDILEDTKMQQLPAYKTTEKHMDFKQINREQAIIDRSSFRFRHDGNGVDMDTEQAELAKNQIYYNAVVDRLNGKFNTLQTVIKGGR